MSQHIAASRSSQGRSQRATYTHFIFANQTAGGAYLVAYTNDADRAARILTALNRGQIRAKGATSDADYALISTHGVGALTPAQAKRFYDTGSAS